MEQIIQKLAITLSIFFVVIGLMGGIIYFFSGAKDTSNIFSGYCQKWGGELRAINSSISCENGECILFGCFKGNENMYRSFNGTKTQVESDLREFNK